MSHESYLLEGGIDWGELMYWIFALISFSAVICGVVEIWFALQESDDNES